MPTPVTSATPYCTAEQLLDYADARELGDWAANYLQRASEGELLNPASDAGRRVAQCLLAASGSLESACLAGGRYTPGDLNALTGAAKEYLVALVARLTVWELAKRRYPVTADPEKVPAAKESLDALEALRTGQHVFGLADQIDAGAGTEAVALVNKNDPNRLVNRNRRLFGFRGGDC
jgi:hypothetical protein